MKRICPCCSKPFVFNRKRRKQDIEDKLIPEDTDNYCEPCIKDIAEIEYEQSYFANCATPYYG